MKKWLWNPTPAYTSAGPELPESRPSDPSIRLLNNAEKANEKYYENIRKLENAFADGRAFLKAKESGKNPLDVDLHWEALIPALKREIPIYVNAGSIREIRDAVQWATQENLDLVLITGTDAWRVADTLVANDIPVIINQVQSLPRRRWESYDTVFKNAALLHEKGVDFAIAFGGGGPTSSNERNLPYEAAKAAAHGLPKDEALKAITLYPAQILGIDDRVGSLEIGKHATLIVTDGDPLDIRTQVLHAFVGGRAVDLSSRHTQLRDKYQDKYTQP